MDVLRVGVGRFQAIVTALCAVSIRQTMPDRHESINGIVSREPAHIAGISTDPFKVRFAASSKTNGERCRH